MRKKAKAWLSLCSLLTAIVCVGGGVQSMQGNSAVADGGVAATYVSSDKTRRSYWEGAGYGKDGYLVFDGIANNANIGFYSDMYNVETTGETVSQTTLMKIGGNSSTGWTPTTGGWNLTKNADDTIAMNSTTKVTTANSDTHVLKSDAVVSGWGVNADIFAGHGVRIFKPAIPGAVTTTQLKMVSSSTASGGNADVNVGFTLNTDEKVYVTLSIFDWDLAEGILSATNCVVAVYGTAYQGGQRAGTQAIADCYGTPLATADVTVNGEYVTFLLDGAVQKDYTFVAYRKDTTATTVTPAIGGVFFDYTQGLQSATYVSSDTTTKGDWESAGYGKDGYMVFDGYRNGAGGGFYSDMYNVGTTGETVSETTLMMVEGGADKGKGWTPATAGGWDISFDGATKVATENTDTHVLKSDAVIRGWGVNSEVFQGHGVRTYKPYIPTVSTNTQLRLNGRNNYNADINLAIALNTDKKVLVTLQVFDYAEKVSAETPIVVGVYNRAFERGGLASRNWSKTVDEFFGTAVATANVTANGTYVTFLLDGAMYDKYTFVAYNPTSTGSSTTGTILASIGGVFFDYYEEEPTASMDSASLTLDGTIGVNFYMNIADGYAKDESAYVLLTDANGVTTEAPIPAAEADGTYKFSVYTVAKDVAKTVKAQLFVDGEAVTEEYEYSVKAYCETVINAAAGTYSDELIALATALLDYGYASDNYFNGATNEFKGDLSAVTATELSAYAATKENELPDGVNVTELSLVLEAETSLKVFFTATDLDGLEITVDGVAVTAVATGRTNEYCITIENISAKALGNAYAIAIGEYMMNVSALTYAYSALNYGGASTGIVNVAKALYLYNQAAVAYFA